MNIEIFLALWFLFVLGLFASTGVTFYSFVRGLASDDITYGVRFFLYGVMSIQLAFFSFLPILLSIVSVNVG